MHSKWEISISRFVSLNFLQLFFFSFDDYEWKTYSCSLLTSLFRTYKTHPFVLSRVCLGFYLQISLIGFSWGITLLIRIYFFNQGPSLFIQVENCSSVPIRLGVLNLVELHINIFTIPKHSYQSFKIETQIFAKNRLQSGQTDTSELFQHISFWCLCTNLESFLKLRRWTFGLCCYHNKILSNCSQ